jgi:hypothetical protein
MRHAKLALFALSPLIALSEPVAAAPLPVDLAKAAAEYDKAQIESSRPLLEKMLASDYHLINSGGEVESRKQFIDESTTGSFKIDPYVVEQPIETVWANAAVLAGYVHITGSDAGKRFDAHLRFADVWAKRNGRWQVVFTEVTKAPAR